MEEELHEYDRTLLADDKRRFTEPLCVPVLANDLINTAELWATLHASAPGETRERLIADIAAALGVAVVMA